MERKAEIKDIVSGLLEQSVDFHLHLAPDPYVTRIGDAIDIANHAKAAGMRAVVFKSSDYPTAPLASLVNKIIRGFEVVGSIVLNHGVGGINPHAVEISAKTGAKVLWMPTVSASASRALKGFSDGITVLDDRGGLINPLKEILGMAREYDLTIGTGHLLKAEVLALFSESQKMGLKKFVLTHPQKVAGSAIDLETQRLLAQKGAFIEHCFGAVWSTSAPIDPIQIAKAIQYVGVDSCLLSTDLGNTRKPSPIEGMRQAIAFLLQSGFSQNEISVLIKRNPCRLLGL